MARKNNTDLVSRALGAIVVLVILAAVLAAIVLPIFLVCAFVYYWWQARKQSKDFPDGGNIAWLTEEEQERFKQLYSDMLALREYVEAESRRSENARLPRNRDGSLDLRNSESREIATNLNRARPMLEELENKVSYLQYKFPYQWTDFNETLKKRNLVAMAFLGWAVGAAFYYARHNAGAPFTLWVELFVPALSAGVGALLAKVFSRYPATRFAPWPYPVDIENVNSPESRRPLRTRNQFLQIAGCAAWIALLAIAIYKGHEQGITESHPSSVVTIMPKEPEYTGLSAEISSADKTNSNASNPGIGRDMSIVLLKGFAVKDKADPKFIESLNVDEVEELTLAIYATHGAEFASVTAQAWADRQTWYRRVSGRTIEQAEKFFTVTDEYNIKMLTRRWNQIQEEEGLPIVPIEESPLAGRAVSPDIETEAVVETKLVLKALPVEDDAPIPANSLRIEDTENWDLAKVRYEINTIYARHGVVFPQREIQEYFESKEWYNAVPGLTFEEAENRFSPSEKGDIEVIAERRKLLNEKK